MKIPLAEFARQAVLVKADDRYKVYDWALERLVVSMTVLHRNKSTTGHKHDSEEIYLILKGSGSIKLNGVRNDVTKGDLIVVAPSSFHQVSNLGSSDLQFLSVFERYEGRGQ